MTFVMRCGIVQPLFTSLRDLAVSFSQRKFHSLSDLNNYYGSVARGNIFIQLETQSFAFFVCNRNRLLKHSYIMKVNDKDIFGSVYIF